MDAYVVGAFVTCFLVAGQNMLCYSLLQFRYLDDGQADDFNVASGYTIAALWGGFQLLSLAVFMRQQRRAAAGSEELEARRKQQRRSGLTFDSFFQYREPREGFRPPVPDLPSFSWSNKGQTNAVLRAVLGWDKATIVQE